MKKYEQNLLNHNDDNGGIRELNKTKRCKIIKKEFKTLWQTQVNSFPKPDTYCRQFKNRVIFESYLRDIKNRKVRVTFTKYRLSARLFRRGILTDSMLREFTVNKHRAEINKKLYK